MKCIPMQGLSEAELCQFFAHPLSLLSIGRPEGNRVFEIQLTSSAGLKLLIFSSIVELPDGDEIGVLSSKFSDSDIDGMHFKWDFNDILAIHKIIGVVDDDFESECGIAIDSAEGLHSIMSGSFPASLVVSSPIFNQRLQVNSFQPFKYYTKKLKCM